MEFDPVLCITAEELRASGIDPGEDIPDCAWVPRASVRHEVRKSQKPISDEDKRNRVLPPVAIDVIFEVPFRWLRIEGTVQT